MHIIYTSAMVTSTSTPGSIVMDVICFTTSDGLCRSITRLCTRNSNLSQVLVPEHKQHIRNISPILFVSWILRADAKSNHDFEVNIKKFTNLYKNRKLSRLWSLTFPTRRLASGYVQHLGRHPHWTLHFEPLVLSTLDQVRTNWHRSRKTLDMQC